MVSKFTRPQFWRSRAVALGAAALALVAPPVMAQIEEIIVTAQKREEKLQDVSVAVTALSGDLIRDNDMAQFGELANNTPGLIFNAFSVGQPEIAIRGVSTKEDGAGASDATVVSVDGIYIAARSAQVFDIFDLERVEVLRGPQSTLYGKNTIAGALNFVTAKPGPDSVVRLRQSVGDYGRFDTAGLVSGQIADELYGKFSFSRRKHDGYLTNILPQWIDPNSGFTVKNPEYGKSQGESDTFNWRAQLRFEPSDALQLTLMLDGADDHNGATNREPIGSLGPLHNCGCASDPVAVNRALGGEGDLHTTLSETEGYMDREVLGVALVADYETRIRHLDDLGFVSRQRLRLGRGLGGPAAVRTVDRPHRRLRQPGTAAHRGGQPRLHLRHQQQRDRERQAVHVGEPARVPRWCARRLAGRRVLLARGNRPARGLRVPDAGRPGAQRQFGLQLFPAQRRRQLGGLRPGHLQRDRPIRCHCGPALLLGQEGLHLIGRWRLRPRAADTLLQRDLDRRVVEQRERTAGRRLSASRGHAALRQHLHRLQGRRVHRLAHHRGGGIDAVRRGDRNELRARAEVGAAGSAPAPEHRRVPDEDQGSAGDPLLPAARAARSASS